jgi:hypothetical protein
MRYVNGILGYVFLAFGLLAVGGPEASAGGALSIAGAILIAIERYCDLKRVTDRAT